MKTRTIRKRQFLSSTILIFGLALISIAAIYFYWRGPETDSTKDIGTWEVRSIDTMKSSRDLARIKLNDRSFTRDIDLQISKIALTGANYVAIGTPYDPEFLPILKRWVQSARKHNMKVWFRGNFSGWEGWFDYPRMDRTTHIAQTRQFILKNSYLFEEDDIFTSCPECENGLIKPEYHNPQSLDEHKSFLISEYEASKEAFRTINKNVKTGYFSMNGDLARLIMDKNTTKALGGIVVIDHYVATPEKLAEDIRQIAEQSGGKIMLGEFGAPIPDIHGKMNEEEQNKWIHEALAQIAPIQELIGMNYWVNTGGTTALWHEDGSEKVAVRTIRDYYLFFKGS